MKPTKREADTLRERRDHLTIEIDRTVFGGYDVYSDEEKERMREELDRIEARLLEYEDGKSFMF